MMNKLNDKNPNPENAKLAAECLEPSSPGESALNKLPKEIIDGLLIRDPEWRGELEKEAFLSYQESEDYPFDEPYKSLQRVTYELMQRATLIEREWLLWKNHRRIAKKSLDDFYEKAYSPCFIASRMAVDEEPLLDVLYVIMDAAVTIDRWERKFKRLKGGWKGNQKKFSNRIIKHQKIKEIVAAHSELGSAGLARLVKKKLNIPESTFYAIRSECLKWAKDVSRTHDVPLWMSLQWEWPQKDFKGKKEFLKGE